MVKLTTIKPFSPILKEKTVNIYNTIFKIHTKYTSLLLLLFYCLVSARDFFGNPIHCMVTDKEQKEYAENVCWITATFTLVNVAKTGFNGRGRSMINSGHDQYEHQKYYQWIVVVLLLQSILFYAPAYLWKGWERGRLKELCSTLGSAVITSDYTDKKKQVVDYFKSDNSRVHTMYVIRYVTCEVLNLLIVAVNMWFLDAIFNKFWIRYFPAVSALIQTDGDLFSLRANELFPKLVKCSYTKVGPSGTLEYRDAQCLLTQNILNEKIFAFLYVWFIVLLILSGCNLIFRSISLLSASLRLNMIRSVAMSSTQTTQINIEFILRDEKIGDWFILYQFGRNINPIVFKEVLDEVANRKRVLNHNDI